MPGPRLTQGPETNVVSRRPRSRMIVPLLLLSVAACQKGAPAPISSAPPAASRAQEHTENPTPPHNAAAEIKRTVAEVTADVNRIQAAPPPEQQRLLPQHTRLVTDMLQRFEARVRAMHVTVDPDWVAVIDSVKMDLDRMPRMRAAELHAYLPAHARRVMRIVACIDMAAM